VILCCSGMSVDPDDVTPLESESREPKCVSTASLFYSESMVAYTQKLENVHYTRGTCLR